LPQILVLQKDLGEALWHNRFVFGNEPLEGGGGENVLLSPSVTPLPLISLPPLLPSCCLCRDHGLNNYKDTKP
jgi:hypothetical protein